MGGKCCCTCTAGKEKQIPNSHEQACTSLFRAELWSDEGAAVLGPVLKRDNHALLPERTYRIKLCKAGNAALGIDVDFSEHESVLPIIGITGGLAAAWNRANNDNLRIRKDDCVIEVNGVRGSTYKMLERCKEDQVLDMVLARPLTTYDLDVSLKGRKPDAGSDALTNLLALAHGPDCSSAVCSRQEGMGCAGRRACCVAC
mmetsp:Transcript_88397/g.189835  ORF Transcript_88397/g.189835 Transcript_88397/m.189835 type:complete len:201 (-) Transcript_88397:65-667(-)